MRANAKEKFVSFHIPFGENPAGISRIPPRLDSSECERAFVSLYSVCLVMHSFSTIALSSLAERWRQRIVKLNKGTGVYSPGDAHSRIFSPRGRQTHQPDQKEHQRRHLFSLSVMSAAAPLVSLLLVRYFRKK
jgi:hypothetical protein